MQSYAGADAMARSRFLGGRGDAPPRGLSAADRVVSPAETDPDWVAVNGQQLLPEDGQLISPVVAS
jgi:hypothetical protein